MTFVSNQPQEFVFVENNLLELLARWQNDKYHKKVAYWIRAKYDKYFFGASLCEVWELIGNGKFYRWMKIVWVLKYLLNDFWERI